MAFKKILDINKNRYASGVASRNDLALAETQLKNTQAQAIDLGVQRAHLGHAIATLIGKPASTFSIPAAPLALKVPAIPAGVPSIFSSAARTSPPPSETWPRPTPRSAWPWRLIIPPLPSAPREALRPPTALKWFLWPSRFWSLEAAGAQTLFAGGLRGGQTAAARAAYDSTVATYRQTVLTGFQEVEDNLAPWAFWSRRLRSRTRR